MSKEEPTRIIMDFGAFCAAAFNRSQGTLLGQFKFVGIEEFDPSEFAGLK